MMTATDERGKRVFIFRLDKERDADVIERMEARPHMTGYIRGLVRRDMYDERLDFAALKASELQAENAKLRELCRHLYTCNQYCDREDGGGGCSACPYQPLECDCGFEERLLELGIEVDA